MCTEGDTRQMSHADLDFPAEEGKGNQDRPDVAGITISEE